MVCKEFINCVPKLIDKHSGCCKCDNSGSCIEQSGTDSCVVCVEKGKKYVFVNDVSPKAFVAKIRIDEKVIIGSDEVRCDYFNIIASDNKKLGILVELKGKDYLHALEQLGNSCRLLNKILISNFDVVFGRIVCRTKNAPNFQNDPTFMKVQREFIKLHGNLIIAKVEYEEKCSKFL